MARPHALAAIDMGSNAIRMIVGEFSDHRLHIVRKLRAPIRLGHDVFATGKITDALTKDVIKALASFQEAAQDHKVSWLRAVATSAVREAANHEQFVKTVKNALNLQIELIDGLEEARLIHLGVSKVIDLHGKKAVLIDIGGGSVEVTLISGEKILASQSFPLGTVRILEEMQRRQLQESEIGILIGDLIAPLTRFLHEHVAGERFDFGVGTGGNLECMADLKERVLNKRPSHYITLDELFDLATRLRKISVSDRISQLKLRPDRADVILPAILVVKAVLRQTDSHRILLPKVGLRDGILWGMIHERWI